MRVSSAGGALPLVAPEITIMPPCLSALIECDQVAAPDGLHHGVDALGEARAGLEGRVGAKRQRQRALLLAAAGRSRRGAGGTRAEFDQCGGDAAARALDEHRLPGRQPAACEQHAVGGQPSGGQAGGLLEAELGRLGTRFWRGTITCSASVPWWTSDSNERFGSSVSSPLQPADADHRVDEHLVAVWIDAGGVAAEDHRQAIGSAGRRRAATTDRDG